MRIARPCSPKDSIYESICRGICPADDGLTGPGFCGGKLTRRLKCKKCTTQWSKRSHAEMSGVITQTDKHLPCC